MSMIILGVVIVLFIGVLAPMISMKIMDGMPRKHTNKDFINHLAEDFHSLF